MHGMYNNMAAFAAGAGLAAAIAMLAATPAAANTAFDEAAGGVPCGTCHQPGKETEAPNPSSFNTNGAQVYYLFSTAGGACHMNIDCAVGQVLGGQSQPAPQPAPQPYQPPYQPQPYQPQPQRYQPQPAPAAVFMYRFYDHCSGSDSYFVVRPGGSPQRAVRFMLKHGHEMHIEIPYGTQWVSACGGWPSDAGPFSVANPGD